METRHTRRTFLGSAAAFTGGLLNGRLVGGAVAAGQASAPIVTRTSHLWSRRRLGASGQPCLSRRAGSRLAIVSVHGGRWRAGNRTDASSIKVTPWAEFGFFAMSVDYRLVGGSPAPAPYVDLRCAIRWVHAHAADYGIDPERVYLIGQSAGGHMVALAATLGDGPYRKLGMGSGARGDVRAVVSVAGPYI